MKCAQCDREMRLSEKVKMGMCQRCRNPNTIHLVVDVFKRHGAAENWEPGESLEAVVRHTILKALIHHKGNRTHTAKELGISLRTLRNRLKVYREAGEMPCRNISGRPAQT